VRRVLGIALALLLVALVGAWWAARPVAPDAFYAPPGNVPPAPGMLLRSEPFARGVPADAQAWRILYTTTRREGVPAVASAIVMVSRTPSAAPRPLVAWTHGTTGVAPGCAPSLLDEPFAHVPALQPLLDAGWLFVATDYVGLGTAGPHAYLIGDSVARSALDAVRAARRIESLGAGDRTVVWGHSQGGHAALWTGMLAPAYASDVPLAGVVAVAPASDLPPLIERAQDTVVGRIMSSFIVEAYAAHHDDVRWSDAVPAWKRPLARDMARRCLAGRSALLSVAQALALGGRIFATSGADGALGARLAANVPSGPISAPLLLAQGLADDLVDPQVQARYVARRCDAGQAIDFRRYAGRDHLSVVAADSPFTANLMAWTRDRFAGMTVPSRCTESTR
jgi:alpha-beta hydrolase superfamily lysophospholipase